MNEDMTINVFEHLYIEQDFPGNLLLTSLDHMYKIRDGKISFPGFSIYAEIRSSDVKSIGGTINGVELIFKKVTPITLYHSIIADDNLEINNTVTIKVGILKNGTLDEIEKKYLFSVKS